MPQSLQRPHPYLLIGGEGEQRTLRLVAQYADACNIGGGDRTVHELDVLQAHCEAVGRDYDTIEKTTLFAINPETTTDDILRMAEPVQKLGFTTAVKPPKSHNGVRTLVLDPETLDLLGPLATGPASRYLFAGRWGRPIRPDNLTDRFNQLAAAAKVRPIGPHQIQHLIASTLLDAGYGVHEVAERLGHDPATLMRYYARVNVARRLQATDRIAELMTAPGIPPGALRNWSGCTTSLLPEAGTSAEMRTG